MLLAFQRDDSTCFTKSPRHRQHHGEMGENSCTCLFSIYASVQIVYASEYICQCVCVHAVLCQKPFKTLFQLSQKRVQVGVTCTFLSICEVYRLHQKACTYMLVAFQIMACVPAFLCAPQYQIKNKTLICKLMQPRLGTICHK